MPTDTPYSIADLARLTDVTPRTVRYYIAQGLLPAPGESGPGAHYGPGHLDRLQLIRRLQRQHLPLAEIRSRLATLTDRDVADALRASEAQPTPDSGSALDYIRTLLGSSPTTPARSSSPSTPTLAMPAAPAPPPPPRRFMVAPPLPAADAVRESAPFPAMSVVASPASATGPMPDPAPGLDAAPAREAAAARAPEPTIERSQWERLSLGPNVELHIRRPLSRHEQKRVDRLITIARQVLQEGTP
jgi:DNA-binding transcriptional MerR regulator